MSTRKHVKPAHEGAAIPDPTRGRDLPPEGHPVDWTPYWANKEMSGDILVSDVIEEPAEESPAEPTPAFDPAPGPAPEPDHPQDEAPKTDA